MALEPPGRSVPQLILGAARAGQPREMSNESSAKDLTQRQEGLLLAAVQEFIANAEPVGSHQIAEHYHLGIRSAMVRNMMAELEDIGYLHQPHTSAGRVPTDRAF